MSSNATAHPVAPGAEPSGALNVLIFGAHPDDSDLFAGGVAALYSLQGHRVRMVSLTNGDAGHFEMGGVPLAQRRRGEAAAAGARLGVEYVTLDHHDCALMPTLEIRHQITRIIRRFEPDLVMAPRPYSNHPDHRYTAQIVQDALCAAGVPNVVSDVPHLRSKPAAVYVWDGFQKPYPFVPDVVVSVEEMIETKLDALDCHVSQMYEFLPYLDGCLDQVPQAPADRRAWLCKWLDPMFSQIATLYRDRLIERYGEARGNEIVYAEAFEVCEYGAPVTESDLKRLFPFI